MPYLIGDAHIEVGPGWVYTRFPEGDVHAVPDGSSDQQAYAERLGYGTGPAAVRKLTERHDVLHSLIAHARGWNRSAVLHGQATGTLPPDEIAHDEECLVFLLARVANVGLDAVLADFWTDGDAA